MKDMQDCIEIEINQGEVTVVFPVESRDGEEEFLEDAIEELLPLVRDALMDGNSVSLGWLVQTYGKAREDMMAFTEKMSNALASGCE